MNTKEIQKMLESARKNMMDDSMRDYAGEQIDIALIELKKLKNQNDQTNNLER